MGVEWNFHILGVKQSLAHTPKAKHNHKEPNLFFSHVSLCPCSSFCWFIAITIRSFRAKEGKSQTCHKFPSPDGLWENCSQQGMCFPRQKLSLPFQCQTLVKQLSDEGNETKGSSTFWRGLIADFCGNNFSPQLFLVLLSNMCSVS